MRWKRNLCGIVLVVTGALAACTALGGAEATPTRDAKPTAEPQSPPSIVIDGPPSGAQVPMGEDVFIQSTATGEDGVMRIDLMVDGAVVRTDGTPDGTSQPQFSLLQLWQPTAMGEHTVVVTAYTEDGTASQPATILVNVTEAPAEGAAEASAGATACTARSSTRLAVREGPGLNYSPRGELQMGQEVDVTGKNDDNSWLQIDFDGAEGWVYASYAYVSDGCETLGIVQAPPAAFGAAGAPAGSGGAPTVTYTPGGPTVTPTLTYTPGGPTVTPTYTPSSTPSPTYTYTPGGPTVTPTYTYTPTATYTPTYTPTTGPSPTYTYTPTTGPTPTYTYTPTQPGPTATYTPSYTPTTQPAAQVAPADANFNNPLNIPLDSTASVTDFVSYPGGDTQDRVRWDISGMNPNAALSGGRARLTIAASCFGSGIENVTFFTGGQTFSCGQTLVDREVTYDSRTGQVTITAVGGSDVYVQWVLTGTAVRLN
jgi:uncharacterized protein YraI